MIYLWRRGSSGANGKGFDDVKESPFKKGELA
jgi:hypothetical protein